MAANERSGSAAEAAKQRSIQRKVDADDRTSKAKKPTRRDAGGRAQVP